MRLRPKIGFSAFALVLAAGAGWSQTVTITLEGSIAPSCQLQTPAAKVELGALTETGSVIVPLFVRCNMPFAVSLQSQSGALATVSPGNLKPEFTASIPYDATLQIPTNVGAITGSCSSAVLLGAIASCKFPDSKGGIALDGDSTLTLTWTLTKQPIAGIYSDTVTITVGPQL